MATRHRHAVGRVRHAETTDDLGALWVLDVDYLETGIPVRYTGKAVREGDTDGKAGCIHAPHDPGIFRNGDVDHLQTTPVSVRHVGMAPRDGQTVGPVGHGNGAYDVRALRTRDIDHLET